MGWDKARETAASHKGGGMFARLENDKDKISGYYVGDPVSRSIYWDPTTNQSRPYTEEDKKSGKKEQPKFALCLFVPGDDKTPGEMKIHEMGIVTFKDVLKFHDKYGVVKVKIKSAKTGKEEEFEVVKARAEVERNGAKGNKKTTYSVLHDGTLSDSPGHLEQLQKSEVHDLDKVATGMSDEDESTDMNSHDKSKGGAKEEKKPAAETKKEEPKEEPLMGADDRNAIAKRMKELPKDTIDKFLTKFGIQKFVQLKAKDKAAAEEFLTAHEPKKEAPKEEPPKEVDPFAD
jgi:hypothetical protein